jgi:hypothetical protein
VNSAVREDEELPMTIGNRCRPLPTAGAALGCLLLTVCAGQTPTATNWIKGGADDQTIARELADCNAQANAALANEQGINADINATRSASSRSEPERLAACEVGACTRRSPLTILGAPARGKSGSHCERPET